MDIVGNTAVEAGAVAPTAADSMYDIAMSGLEGLDLTPDDGQVAEEAAPAVETPDNHAAEAAPAAEAPALENQEASPSPLTAALDGIEPDDLAPEMRAVYDRMVAQDKARQADYTRKTQALAEDRRVLEANTPAPIVEQPVAQQVPAAPGDEEAELYAALKLVPFDPAQLAESGTPEQWLQHFSNLAKVESLRMARLTYGMVQPQVEQLTQAQANAQEATWQREVHTYMGAHPELEPYRTEMGQLLTAGLTLEDAGTYVGARFLESDRMAQAMELARATAQKRADSVRDAQGRFATPSGSTKPGERTVLSPNAPTSEIMMAGAREEGLV